MRSSLPPVAEMQRAYRASDPAYDGIFYFGVRTTGIFCRPSCRAKKPRPVNVEYFPDAQAARIAGYRPCKRCRPVAEEGTPGWVRRVLARVAARQWLREGDLRRMGVEPARAGRYFRQRYGMSFAAYQRGLRMGEAFMAIRNGAGVQRVAQEQGYESASGFRTAFSRLFGQRPQAAAAGDCICWGLYESPLGPLVLGATSAGVCLLAFSDQGTPESRLRALGERLALPVVPGENRHLLRLREELRRYFAGTLRSFSVPLVYPGTPFQVKVWNQLLRIPYGETRSYADLAGAVGSPRALRAVGTANGRNRIAILIPCHRVVNKDGRLGGYGGGFWRKRWLLDLERSRCARP